VVSSIKETFKGLSEKIRSKKRTVNEAGGQKKGSSGRLWPQVHRTLTWCKGTQDEQRDLVPSLQDRGKGLGKRLNTEISHMLTIGPGLEWRNISANRRLTFPTNQQKAGRKKKEHGDVEKDRCAIEEESKGRTGRTRIRS